MLSYAKHSYPIRENLTRPSLHSSSQSISEAHHLQVWRKYLKSKLCGIVMFIWIFIGVVIAVCVYRR